MSSQSLGVIPTKTQPRGGIAPLVLYYPHMLNPSTIITLSWLIFLGYWILTANSVKPTQETKVDVNSTGWNITGKIFFAFLALESFDKFPIPPFSIHILPRLPIFQLTGVILTILGVITAITARKTLSTNWSSNVDFKKGHELITHGIYAYVRHPIYTGILTMSLGLILFSGNISAFLFFTVITWFMIYKLKNEEQLMIKHFPKEYPAYMKKVKAIIPFLY